MRTAVALWQVFVAASIPARVVLLGVAVLAAGRVSWVLAQVNVWAAARYRVVPGPSWWRLWQVQVVRLPRAGGGR